MNQFQQFIHRFSSLDPDVFAAFKEVARKDVYRKNDLIAKPSVVCRRVGFLESGICRVYHLHNSKEITDYFNTIDRNPLVSSFRSFLKEEPVDTYVEAITEVVCYSISKDELENIYSSFPEVNRIGRLLVEQTYLTALERIESLQYQSASDRYIDFLKQYPMLINTIPNHYIASYLGVTPESLSRIRKNLL